MPDRLVITFGEENPKTGLPNYTVEEKEFSAQDKVDFSPDIQEEKRLMRVMDQQAIIDDCDNKIKLLEEEANRPSREISFALAKGLDVPAEASKHLKEIEAKLNDVRNIREPARLALLQLNGG